MSHTLKTQPINKKIKLQQIKVSTQLTIVSETYKGEISNYRHVCNKNDIVYCHVVLYTKRHNGLLDRNMSLIVNSILLYNKYALDDNPIDQSVISILLDTWLASQHR